MNMQKAKAILKREGYVVEKVKDKYIVKRKEQGCPIQSRWLFNTPITASEVVRIARMYTSEGSRTSIKRSLKEEDRTKNRAATRQMIEQERWDEYPTQGKIKSGNLWNWD